MGLISKIKTVGGRIGVKASSLSAKIGQRLPNPAIKVGSKIVGVLGKVAKSPVGKVGLRVGRVATKVVKRAPVLSAIGGIIAISKATKRLRKQPTTQEQVIGGENGGILSTIKKGIVTAGLVGAGLFVAEQVAEKVGVRGGAGFFGRKTRKKKRKGKKRRKGRNFIPRHRHKIIRQKARTIVRSISSRSKRKRKGKRVSFTTKDGRKVSFVSRR